MKKQSKQNIFLMYKLRIQNTFLATWLIIMPCLIVMFADLGTGAGAAPIFIMMHVLSFLFGYWIFEIILEIFSKKNKKQAVYMSFILDGLFIAPYLISIGSSLWLFTSNTIVLLLQISGRIKIIKQFKEIYVVQEVEEYDKKVLLDSLFKFVSPNIIIDAILFVILLFGGYENTTITIYAFLRVIVMVTGLLALIATVKEKKALKILNIIFGIISIIFTFDLIELSYGIDHLVAIRKYFKEKEQMSSGDL